MINSIERKKTDWEKILMEWADLNSEPLCLSLHLSCEIGGSIVHYVVCLNRNYCANQKYNLVSIYMKRYLPISLRIELCFNKQSHTILLCLVVFLLENNLYVRLSVWRKLRGTVYTLRRCYATTLQLRYSVASLHLVQDWITATPL